VLKKFHLQPLDTPSLATDRLTTVQVDPQLEEAVVGLGTCLKSSVRHDGRNAIKKLEAKDVLPNINHTQATERSEHAVFCPW